jgi:hypothetical protein
VGDGGWDVSPVGFDTALALRELGCLEVLRRHVAAAGCLERSAARVWLAGLTTKTGVPRWSRVRTCGRLAVAFSDVADALVGVAPLWCRDRGCPNCTRRLARERATKLYLHALASPNIDTKKLMFVTLTQPRHQQSCLPAVNLLNDTWRSMATSKRGRALLRDVSLLRTLEVVWSPHPRGDWHPHFHILAQADPKWCSLLVALWLHHSGGSHMGQRYMHADDGSYLEVLKYAVKGMGELPPHVGRDVFYALAGKRLVTATGGWSGWQDAGPKLPPMRLGHHLDGQLPSSMEAVRRWRDTKLTLPEILAMKSK